VAEKSPDALPMFASLYKKTILGHPYLVVLLYALVIALFGSHLKDFRMDASSDSLVLENDADLRYYEATRELFGSDDYIILAIALDKDALSDDVLQAIQAMSRELGTLASIESVNSILTVPLFQSPKVTLYEMGSRYNTLLTEGCDRKLAFQELTTSPLWSSNLISRDGRTTAVVLTMKSDKAYTDLRDERYRLRRELAQGSLSPDQSKRLKLVTDLYNRRHAELSAERRSM